MAEGLDALGVVGVVEGMDLSRVPVSVEPQGEAVGWRADGRGYYTSSEDAQGVRATLNAVECQP